MEISVAELLKGKPTIIKNKEFLDYVCVIHQRKPIFENSTCPDEEKMYRELLRLKKERS